MSGYLSQLPSGLLVIDDETDMSAYGPPFVDGEELGRGYIPRDWNEDPFGSFAKPFGLPLIPESEWPERIEEMERTKTRLSDIIKTAGMRSKNQKSTSYCWVFAATSAVQVVRILQGEPHVELSPASVGAPVKNYRNVGGWSTEAIRYGAEHGWVPSDLWPDTAIQKSYDTEETRQKRREFIVSEWDELRPRNEAELMTCLFARIPVAIGQNHWSHAILACDPLRRDSGYGHLDLNSWSESYGDKGWFAQFGSKRFADDAVAPRVAP